MQKSSLSHRILAILVSISVLSATTLAGADESVSSLPIEEPAAQIEVDEFEPFRASSMLLQAGGGLLGLVVLAGLFITPVLVVPKLSQDQASAMATLLTLTLITATPFVATAGINWTGKALGGRSHYWYSFLGLMAGWMVGGIILSSEFFFSESRSLSTATTVVLGIAWLGSAIAGGVVGYNLAEHYANRRSEATLQINPVLDDTGSMSGAVLSIGFWF